MGTRGLYVYRYNGRYYVFYNHADSYPEGLGSWIVADIPTDPGEHKEWLKRMRGTYAEIEKVLEEEILTVTDKDRKAFLSKPYAHQSKCDALIDDNIEQMPSVLPDLGDGCIIEWIYTVDLDRGVFSVDNGAHFHVNKIPRNDVWIKALAMDSNGSRTLDTDLVPKDCIAHLAVVPKPPTPALLKAYGGLAIEPIRAKTAFDLDSAFSHKYLLRLFIWYKFSRKYGRHLPDFLYGWEPQEFVFREFVHATLCLASGDPDTVRYIPGERLRKPLGEGYCWLKDEDENPTLLPIFMQGCHSPGVTPGSSPIHGTSYWFGGVVICLAVRLGHDDHRKAAIAEAVAFGKKSGRKWFDAALISIEHVVLLRLLPGDVVKHTDAISLVSIPAHTSLHPGHRPAVNKPRVEFGLSGELTNIENPTEVTAAREVSPVAETKPPKRARIQGPNEPLGHAAVLSNHEYECEPGPEPIDKAAELLEMISPGFVALMHLFDGAAYSQLKPFASPNEGIFPAEIMHMILSYTDDETYHTCAKVSRGIRNFCERNARILEGYTILGYQAPMTFTILDRETGVVEDIPLCLYSQWYEDGGDTNWCPIVGSKERPSFLNDVEISFAGVAAQSRRTRQGQRHDTGDLRGWRPLDSVYCIEEHNVSNSMVIWETYLRNFFTADWDWLGFVHRERHCSHIPFKTRLLYMTRIGNLNRQNAELWVLLKSPPDDREETWGESVRHAEEMLKKSEVQHPMWLLLALGSNARAFRWEAVEGAEGEAKGAAKKSMTLEGTVEVAKTQDVQFREDRTGDTKHNKWGEAEEPNTPGANAKEGQQEDPADPVQPPSTPQPHRKLVPKLDGKLLSINVEKDKHTLQSFLHQIKSLTRPETASKDS